MIPMETLNAVQCALPVQSYRVFQYIVNPAPIKATLYCMDTVFLNMILASLPYLSK